MEAEYEQCDQATYMKSMYSQPHNSKPDENPQSARNEYTDIWESPLPEAVPPQQSKLEHFDLV